MTKDPQITAAVKEILDLIKNISPGKSVELRVPPYGAIQCVAGSNHRRGTPPNTVEMSADTLVLLTSNPKNWDNLVKTGAISASGINSNLSTIFDELCRIYKSKS